MPKNLNTKPDSNENIGQTEASGSSKEVSTGDVLAAVASIHAELAHIKAEICLKIETKISEVTTTLRGEIAALKSENDTAVAALKVQLEMQNQTLKELACSASNTLDIIQEMEDKVRKLSRQVETLSEKCLDLEGRSKRLNLRITGIKEGSESGQKPREFAAQMLKEALYLEETPVIDRAHRALRRRPGDNEPPRHLIMRLHHYHVYEDIMQKAMSIKDLKYRSQRTQIFRDIPPEVVRRRAAFTPARRILRDKPSVRFGLLYPARLRVSCNGTEIFFTNPDEAHQYAVRLFGSTAEDRNG